MLPSFLLYIISIALLSLVISTNASNISSTTVSSTTSSTSKPDCGIPLPTLENGHYNLTSNKTTLGDTANVTCDSGYDANTTTITCQDTGTWSAAACTQKDCGIPLPTLENGHYNLTSNITTLEATANVTCDSGYDANTTAITCQDTGTWSAAACTRKDCGIPLPTLENGHYNLTSNKTTLGATANVTCDSGYDANTTTITCQDTGTWSVAACTPKDVEYNQTCFHIENTCITPNATCQNISSTEAKCLCKQDFVYIDEQCFEKLAIKMSDLRLKVTEIKSNYIKLRWSTPNNFQKIVTKFVFTLTNLHSNDTRSFKVNVTADTYYEKPIDMLIPGTKYNLVYYVTNHIGVPSKESGIELVITEPLPPDYINIVNVTVNGFTVVWEYNVMYSFDKMSIVIEPVTDQLNCSFNIYEKGNCSFPRSDDNKSVDIWGLDSGTSYTVRIYTIFETVLSGTSKNKSSYTIPQLPQNISAPLERRRSNSFNISFIDENTNFGWWTVKVYQNSTLTSEKNQTREENEMLVGELDSGTLYYVNVKTFVPGFESISKNLSIYTRPSDLKSLSIPKKSVYENNFTILYETFDENYDTVEIIICQDDDSHTCSSSVITHEKNTSTYTVPNLDVSTIYRVCVRLVLNSTEEVLTSWSFMNKSSYTAPEVPFADLKHSDFRTVTLNLTRNEKKRFDHYQISYQDDKQQTKTFDRNETYPKIQHLIPGTLYTFKVYAVLTDIFSEKYTIVETYTRPANVINMSVNKTTNSSMNVQWQPPSEGRVERYEVLFNCTSPNQGSVMKNLHNYSGPNLTSDIQNLDPGTSCYAIITTFVGELQGNNSKFELDKTTNEMAPGAVIIKGNDTDKTMISLSWLNPQMSNGIIRKYKLIIKDLENESCLKKKYIFTNCLSDSCNHGSVYCKDTENITEGKPCEGNADKQLNLTTLNQNITELHPFWNYSIEIQAFTKCWGKVTSAYLKTKTDRPAASPSLEVNMKTHNTISLQWKELDKKDRNGVIVGYIIKYNSSNSTCSNALDGQMIQKVQNVSGNKLEQNLTDLRPYWSYDISISALTSAGEGDFSNFTSVKTNESVPGKIDYEGSGNYSDRSATVNWTKPCRTNGVLTGFNISILNQDNNSIISESTGPENTAFVIEKLLPYRNYTVKVAAKTEIGQGNFSEGVNFRTKIGRPEKPKYPRVVEIKSTSFVIKWGTPDLYTGPTNYSVVVQDVVNISKSFHNNTGVNFNATECKIEGLDEYWEYNITVIAITGTYDTPSQIITKRTAEDKPGNIRRLTLESEKDILKKRSISVKWEEPGVRDRNGVILKYFVHIYDDDNKTINIFDTKDNMTMTYNYSGLLPGEYSVQVFGHTNVGNGTKVTKRVAVEAGAPLQVSEESETGLLMKPGTKKPSDTQRQISVQLPLRRFLCNSSSGQLTRLGLVVAQSDQATDDSFFGSHKDFDDKISNVYKSWFNVKDMDSIKPYIATFLDLNESCGQINVGNLGVHENNVQDYENFFVGQEGECLGKNNDKYCNGELEPGRSYSVKSFACTVNGCTETKYSSPISTDPVLTDSTVAIAAGISSAVVVIAIVAVVVFVMRRKQLACFTKDDESFNTHIPGEGINLDKIESKKKNHFRQGPIKLSDFPAAVDKFHKDSDLLFADAYKMLKEKSPSHPMTAAEQQCCRPKNRYTNILPFDHSRVKLRPSDDMEGSDYINANYIPGYTSRREYIATQGPMLATIDDFWRMVWEQNVDTIVMLTKLMEKGRHKCDKYWPDLGEPVFYGDLVVSLQSESNLSDYTIMIFEIKMGIKQKKIKHFHFLQWPDFGCPDKHWPVINFISMVRQYRPPFPKGPLLVHCSAGVGRTGTFIAVDYLLQHIRDHDEVDIFNLVLDMRNHRLNMVQTEDQYIYIHECVKAFITTDEEEEEDDEAIYVNTGFGADEEENIYVNA